MKTKSSCLLSALFLIALATFNFNFSAAFAQGSLVPSGAPAPTMKSLGQIEPRTDVLTLSGNANNQFIINQGGSYYLTTNIIGVANKNGISILADNVTLDLNGFTVFGVTNSASGITVNGQHGGLVVRNGMVSGWGGNGIAAGNASESEFSHLRAMTNGGNGNGGLGIKVGSGNTLVNCTVAANLGDGIDTSSNCKLVNCNVDGNAQGISAGNGCTVDHCVAANNSSYGISGGQNCTILGCSTVTNVGGIHIGNGGIIRDCVANWDSVGLVAGNGCIITGCTANNNVNGGMIIGDNCQAGQCVALANAGGIGTGDGCTVRNCSASDSSNGFGISVGSNCNVTGCTADDNNLSGINSGNNCTIAACIANNNLEGIATLNGCTIKDSTASTNFYDGVYTGDICVIKDSTAGQNDVEGFTTGNGCSLSGCVATANNFGFSLNSECSIDHCTATANNFVGILVQYSCLVKDNTTASNDRYVAPDDGAGIEADQSGNRIEGNNSNSDYNGIHVTGSENIVIKNTVRAAINLNYFIVGGNMAGSVVSATPETSGIDGSSGGIGLGSTDPWANFSF